MMNHATRPPDRAAVRNELRDVARSVLADRCSPAAVRERFEADRAFDSGLWKLAGDLGWLSLEVPEESGGGGMCFAESVVLLEELGAHVAAGPFLGHMVAAWALAVAGRRDEAASLVDGSRVASIVPCDLAADGRLAPSLRAATVGASEVLVSGRLPVVSDVADVEVVLVPAVRDDGELVIAELDMVSDGSISLRRHQAVDRTRALAEVRLTSARATVISSGAPARALLRGCHERLFVGIAADSLGLASRLLQMTVEYVNEREQFGWVVGTFQAVKHRCADMFVDVTSSKIAIDQAVDALEHGPDQARMYWASAAKAHVSSAAATIAGGALQLHGAIGFTWEHDLHILMKRAKLNVEMCGKPGAHRARIVRCLVSSDSIQMGGLDGWL